MYVHRVEFTFAGEAMPEDLSEMAMSYLEALRTNGQVCGREWPLHLDGKTGVSTVLAPAADSLDAKFNGQYVSKAISRAVEAGVVISSAVLGKDLDGGEPCQCGAHGGYILWTSYVNMESPVCCLDCFAPVPLYMLPVLESGEYYEIRSWAGDYQDCDSLQMRCTVLEKSATRQLSELNSALSKEGRGVGKTLAKLTGKPVYYYLYSDRQGVTAEQEKQRRCPSCGEPWLLDEPLHDLFSFRCDRCRLLSNISWHVR